MGAPDAQGPMVEPRKRNAAPTAVRQRRRRCDGGWTGASRSWGRPRHSGQVGKEVGERSCERTSTGGCAGKSQLSKACIHIPITDMSFFSLEIRRQPHMAGDAGIPFDVHPSNPTDPARLPSWQPHAPDLGHRPRSGVCSCSNLFLFQALGNHRW